ncbi:MAG: pyridoxine 5'-phosphate synthase [Vampirovibrio sp.]|nr:pyridoxine 5'-phosphate synthase [Vampirovibrio sp.]
MVKLGVNIDHVATLRNARGESFPDPIQAALVAEENGADGITAHLREDRRHIRDNDILELKAAIKTRLNLEMANTGEMVAIACKLRPYMVTLVPERREELTTEGGLNVLGNLDSLQRSTALLKDAGILVSLFVEPSENQIAASAQTGAEFVELHTGKYAHAYTAGSPKEELGRLIQAADQSKELGLQVNAGHGLNYENTLDILVIPHLVELNIGHSLISESVFTGLGSAVGRMKALISVPASSPV